MIKVYYFNDPLINNIKSVYIPTGSPAANLIWLEVVAKLVLVFEAVKLGMMGAAPQMPDGQGPLIQRSDPGSTSVSWWIS